MDMGRYDIIGDVHGCASHLRRLLDDMGYREDDATGAYRHPDRQAVFVGDLVSFYARVLKVGRTSITVDVEVFAQRGRQGRKDIVKVTEAQLTYVAVDAERNPRPVPE